MASKKGDKKPKAIRDSGKQAKREASSKKGARKRSERKKASGRDEKRGSLDFPVVGFGSSAGGLDALEKVLEHLPPDLDMAYIVVQHLSPDHESALDQILSNQTLMIVTDIENGERIEPNHFYILPPDSTVRIEAGRLHLEKRDRSTVPMPIDLFFESLAEEMRERAIAIVLSGTGTDGSLGVRAVKQQGGITIAQDDSASYRGMPESAVSSGAIDAVLGPRQIAGRLANLSKDTFLRDPDGVADAPDEDGKKALKRIFGMLRKHSGLDFSQYKEATINRRIRRRMALRRVSDLSGYEQLLRSDQTELESLENDLLIRVTSFFRDTEVFDYLKKRVLPQLVSEHDGERLRVWVPGCATGEEVYSLAILLAETQSAEDEPRFQIFGTDVSERAIEYARRGEYPENITQQIPDALVKKYFSKVDGFLRISSRIREACIFARQDLTRDPPFSNLALVSCRNLLIYLDAEFQKQVFAILQYSLGAGGILLLGTSETIGGEKAFEPVHRKYRIYRKIENGGTLPGPMSLDTSERSTAPPSAEARKPESKTESLSEIADRIVLETLPGVIINEEYEILQFRGRTGRFLEVPQGAPSFNLLKMTRRGLLAAMRMGIEKAKRTGKPWSRSNINLQIDGEAILIDLKVVPFLHRKGRYLVVTFNERPDDAVPETDSETDGKESTRMKRELTATREYLQSIIEDQEVMNEELRSANEEIQSSNEELQSTNEELETAKEELQSSNEELTTLNEELTMRNQELDRLNDDLVNVLTSIDIPIAILDGEMRLRRFNPAAKEMLDLIPADIGRPISDMRASSDIGRLEEIARKVTTDLKPRAIEVETPKGEYELVIQPYKTTDNRIDGVVVVLLVDRASSDARGTEEL